MNQKILVANDLTWLFTFGIDVGHVLPEPGVELPCNVEWAAWKNSGRHRLAQSVKHKQSAIAQGFHDCGRLIVHVSPRDILMGTIASSRTVMFSAMAVHVESAPIGFANVTPRPTPMLTCGLLPLPVGFSPSAISNTVIVGMHPFWDYQWCWTGVLGDMAVGAALGCVSLLITILTLGNPAAMGAKEIARGVVQDIVIGLGLEAFGRFAGLGERTVEWGRGMRPANDAASGSDPSSWPSI